MDQMDRLVNQEIKDPKDRLAMTPKEEPKGKPAKKDPLDPLDPLVLQALQELRQPMDLQAPKAHLVRKATLGLREHLDLRDLLVHQMPAWMRPIALVPRAAAPLFLEVSAIAKLEKLAVCSN